ncbi:MAG: pentapeptide repeat-containing protein [Bdellovibrionales bacterium]|jgi:uncharacterized protein YjbI with pentapeptide repeats|nr:pentapeptide repeat-containing protein [Bdellovibrionales bacterium]MBT3524714.1 pentapeptide repeat-containing protein [Bdellovibrionales bacterium]MBT7669580.1 pentapeptide repeat-containing protein [Bdellovibrionales bacterium]
MKKLTIVTLISILFALPLFAQDQGCRYSVHPIQGQKMCWRMKSITPGGDPSPVPCRNIKFLGECGIFVDDNLAGTKFTFNHLGSRYLRTFLADTDFSGTTVKAFEVNESNMNGANFSETTFDGRDQMLPFFGNISFFETSLKNVMAQGAKFLSGLFKSSQIINGDFSFSEFTGTFLMESDLTGTNFFDANFQNVIIGNSTLDKVNFDTTLWEQGAIQKSTINGTKLIDSTFIDLKAADITGKKVEITNSTFKNSSFENSKISLASGTTNLTLENVIMVESRFDGNIRGLNLTNMRFERDKFESIPFSGGHRYSNVNFDNIKLPPSENNLPSKSVVIGGAIKNSTFNNNELIYNFDLEKVNFNNVTFESPAQNRIHTPEFYFELTESSFVDTRMNTKEETKILLSLENVVFKNFSYNKNNISIPINRLPVLNGVYKQVEFSNVELNSVRFIDANSEESGFTSWRDVKFNNFAAMFNVSNISIKDVGFASGVIVKGNFVKSKMENVTFLRAGVVADFNNAVFSNVSFEDVLYIKNSVFDNVNLKNMNIAAIYLSNVSFKGSILDHVKIVGLMDHLDFKNSLISNSSFKCKQNAECTMDNISFLLSRMNNVDLSNLTISESSFDRALCRSCNFSGAKFNTVSIDKARFPKSNFKGADLSTLTGYDLETFKGAFADNNTLFPYPFRAHRDVRAQALKYGFIFVD